MNTTTESSTTANSVAVTDSSQQSDDQSSTYVQSSQTTTTTDLLLDCPQITCGSFLNHHHQPSLPSCSSGNQSKSDEHEFANADLKFGEQFASSLAAFLPQPIATTSLSASNNLLDNKLDSSTHSIARSSSCSPPLIETHSSTANNSTIHSSTITEFNHQQQQLNTPPPSKSPDELNKLSNSSLLDTDDLVVKTGELINDKFSVEQLKKQLAEQINQQLLNQQQQLNDDDDDSMSGDERSEMDDEEYSEDCSSEEEKMTGTAVVTTKKRSRSLVPHSCSKKRRKQSNPVRCEFDSTDKLTESQFNQLDQLNQHLKKQLDETGIEQQNELINNIKNLECLQQTLQSQLTKNSTNNSNRNNSKKQDDDEQEDGLIRKFPNTLSGAANAVARFFLSNHQTGNALDSTTKADNCESQINYTYYLAAAAAVATNASLMGTKHCLNYCKECCCPFLSTEHEKLYRQLEQQKDVSAVAATKDSCTASSQQQPNYEKSSVFAQQLQNLVQQSKLIEEIESVFGSSYEIGQLPQRNAIDAMQLIKQLGKFKKFIYS